MDKGYPFNVSYVLKDEKELLFQIIRISFLWKSCPHSESPVLAVYSSRKQNKTLSMNQQITLTVYTYKFLSIHLKTDV